jgi:transcriptional regulator with XRE-family HTH domain
VNPLLDAIRQERRELHFSQAEIAARLIALDQQEQEILTGKVRTEKQVSLTFGRDIIKWEGGALAIGGKGYKFVKALYEADEMQLEIAALEELVWQDDISKGKFIKQHTFVVALQRFSERLEKEKFPYKLLPIRSKERYEIMEHKAGKKPTAKRIQSEITGARLGITFGCENVRSD